MRPTEAGAGGELSPRAPEGHSVRGVTHGGGAEGVQLPSGVGERWERGCSTSGMERRGSCSRGNGQTAREYFFQWKRWGFILIRHQELCWGRAGRIKYPCLYAFVLLRRHWRPTLVCCVPGTEAESRRQGLSSRPLEMLPETWRHRKFPERRWSFSPKRQNVLQGKQHELVTVWDGQGLVFYLWNSEGSGRQYCIERAN